jgi:pyruvate/2-oxoglutarate dehydrogenase complex dihydrolipoamide dehydrogenase (E3) component
VPPIPGLAEAGYLTNETVFDLTELPRRLVVIGAGPIGCELAQAFARLGSGVVLLDQADRILPKDDPDAAAMVARGLAASGVRTELTASVERVEKGPGGTVVRTGGRQRLELVADRILVATGRVPNVDHLELQAARVGVDRIGIVVDDRLRTGNPRVYAVGDVCSPLQFTHQADAQARLVLANALFFGRGRASRLVIPWCTYTTPELAQVGLTAMEATNRGIAADVVTIPFSEVDRAVLDAETDGMLRVVLARGTDRILGATVVARRAGELIGEAVLAMTNGLGLGKVGRAVHPYPTETDAYRRAADQWRRAKLTPGVRRLLAGWFRIFH